MCIPQDATNIDINRDGIISETEFRAYKGHFALADSDGDGSVTQGELVDYQGEYGGGGNLSSIDRDQDGRISKAEFDPYTGSMASADSDGDGSVSDVELDRYMRTYGGSEREQTDGNTSSLDLDGDGRISSGDFEAYTGSFESADGDGDGSVSAEELALFQTTYGGSGNLTRLDRDGDGQVFF